MLLPITSIMVWWPRRPETPENIERSMGLPFLGLRLLAGGLAGDGGSVDLAHREHLAHGHGGGGAGAAGHDEVGPGGAELGAGDHTGHLVAVLVVPGDLAADHGGGGQ